MIFKLCAACRCVNDAEAKRCEDCGAALEPAEPPATAASATPDTAPPPVDLTLRELPTPQPASPVQRRAAPFAGTAADSAELLSALPTLHDELVVSDPPAAQFAGAAEPQASAALAEARSERRAAVRRARLQASAAALGNFVPEVLVLDRDALARDTLCGLLRRFGFGVIGVADAGRAAALLAERPFMAVFADIALDGADGGGGIGFCRRLREAAAPSVLVLVSPPLNAVDRVRAQLLGFEDVLHKPVQRGDVARVLDGRGVALPSDPRRH